MVPPTPLLMGSIFTDDFILFLDFQTVSILVFQILFSKRISTEVVTRLSHDQVAFFKTFRDTAQNKTDYQPRRLQDKTNSTTTMQLTTAL